MWFDMFLSIMLLFKILVCGDSFLSMIFFIGRYLYVWAYVYCFPIPSLTDDPIAKRLQSAPNPPPETKPIEMMDGLAESLPKVNKDCNMN